MRVIIPRNLMYYGSKQYRALYESHSTPEKRQKAMFWYQDLMHYVNGTGEHARRKRDMLRKYHSNRDYLGSVGIDEKGNPFETYELFPIERNGHTLDAVKYYPEVSFGERLLEISSNQFHCQRCKLMGNEETFTTYYSCS